MTDSAVTLSLAKAKELHVKDGDSILVSGYIGDHGMAVMLAREALELETDIRTESYLQKKS